MKFQMNFTTSYDDVIRFTSAEDLHRFYTEHGCDGLELMPLAILYSGSSGCLSAAEKVSADCAGDGDGDSLLLYRGLGKSGAGRI